MPYKLPLNPQPYVQKVETMYERESLCLLGGALKCKMKLAKPPRTLVHAVLGVCKEGLCVPEQYCISKALCLFFFVLRVLLVLPLHEEERKRQASLCERVCYVILLEVLID